MASSLFLAHNEALAPPYRVLIDTNFINFSLQNKLELVSGMMDCLYAKCASFFLFVSLPFPPLSIRPSVIFVGGFFLCFFASLSEGWRSGSLS